MYPIDLNDENERHARLAYIDERISRLRNQMNHIRRNLATREKRAKNRRHIGSLAAQYDNCVNVIAALSKERAALAAMREGENARG